MAENYEPPKEPGKALDEFLRIMNEAQERFEVKQVFGLIMAGKMEEATTYYSGMSQGHQEALIHCVAKAGEMVRSHKTSVGDGEHPAGASHDPTPVCGDPECTVDHYSAKRSQ